jgi:hypothetical protein
MTTIFMGCLSEDVLRTEDPEPDRRQHTPRAADSASAQTNAPHQITCAA